MNECSDCGHHFTDAEAGKDFDESLKPYSCCPACGSDDYSEPEFKVPPKITVTPVSTKALEKQARKVMRGFVSRPMDDNANYRRDMIAAGRGRLLK